MSNTGAIIARLWALGSALLLIAAIAWAFYPLPRSGRDSLSNPPADSGRDPQSRDAAPVSAGSTPLPLHAFRDELWPDALDHARLVDTPAVASVPEPPTLPITLLGVTRDAITGATRAALYDADRDAVHLVAEGDSIGRVLVTRIDSAGIDVNDAGRDARINLHGDAR